MDISKHIGTYLVKNKFVSITGLGTLNLKRTNAKVMNGEIQPPQYKIEYSKVSSIDDQFPNYIGTQENISSNNAANFITQFSREVKEAVQSGQPYILDGVGRFVKEGNDIGFQAVSDFDAGEFIIEAPLEVPKFESDQARSSLNTPIVPESKNLSKILIPLGSLLLLAGLIYFGYKYLNSADPKIAEESAPEIITTDNMLKVTDSATKVDTSSMAAADSNSSTTVPVAQLSADSSRKDTTKAAYIGPAMDIVTRTYTNQASADVYAKKLKTFGREVLVKMVDSSSYQVIIHLSKTDKPADIVINEIRSFYNPGDKYGKVEVAR
jgi:nucleoid DNA-binding protein